MSAPSRAGPSSPPSHLAQPPPPPSASTASASHPEPYDSPLKVAPPTSTSSTYAAGGQETDGPDEAGDEREDGDLGLRAGPAAVRSSPVRDKGKGRAVEGPYSHVRGASGDVVLDMRPAGDEDEDDEAAEERRIQQNLAKWSRADAKRRASLRRSTKLVMPSLPSPPPLSPTSLVRRTSTLLRTGSRRRAGSGTVEASSLEAGDFELGGTDAMQLEEGVAGRRARKKLSVQVGAAEGSATTLVDAGRPSGKGGLAQVGEDDEAVRAGGPSRLPPDERLSLDNASLVTPTSTHHPSNPFSPSNASFVSLESTATDRTARAASRFIEDLPVLPSSTPSTPQGSPTKRSSMAPGSNPFLDVVVTSPTPTRPGALSLRTGSSHTLHTVNSNASTVHTPTTASFCAPAPPPPRTPSPAWSSNHSTPFSSPGLYTPANARQRRPSPRTSMPSMRAASPSSSAYGAQQEQRRRGGDIGDDDEDDIGWLDWLLCGCFRVGDGQRDGRIEQQGRTNPME
ncbi:hypothetical protein JCM3775_003478 [Rhodotorula graminis]